MTLVGRDQELSRIDRWLSDGHLDARRDGRVNAGADADVEGAAPTSVLLIEGEAGIGKTALWAETLRRGRDRGSEVLTCRASASEAELSYVGLSDLLRDCEDGSFDELPSPQRHPLDVALLRTEASEGGLDPRAVGIGLLALLQVLSRERPLLVAVDDAQWLDSPTARVLAFAIRRVGGPGVRLVAAVRTGESPTRRRNGLSLAQLERELEAGSIERLPVGPLTLAATHELVRQQLGKSIPRPVLVRIHQASGGNPFFTLEIAREVLRTGAPRPGEPLPVPADHHEVVLLRLRRLPRRTREALLVVASLSRPTISDVDAEALGPAERAGYVRVEPGGRLSFSHPLFGSVLYSSISDEERREIHTRLAERAEGVEERARHRALAATAPDRGTAELLDEATDAALSRGAADVAVELKELARLLTPEEDRKEAVRRDIELADRRYFAGDAMGARRELERSLTSLPPGDDRARVLLELGSVLWTQGESERGLELLSNALEDAKAPSLRAQIHSRASSFSLDCDSALEHAEAALALIDEHTDPALYSFALHNMALWKLYAGGGADHEAIERGTRLQKEAATWEMSTVPAVWARLLDDFESARRLNEDLLRAFSETGDEASSAGILAHLAVIEAMTGHMERARTRADEALRLAEQTEQDTYVMVAFHAKGQVLARAGDLDQARAAGNEILRRLEEQPDATLEAMARGMLGLTALTGDDLAEADRQFTAVEAILDAQHTREPAADRIHGDHAEAVISLGELARAEELIEAMERRARLLPRPWILAVSARCRGLLNAAQGDLDAAMEDYRRALEAHESLDMPSEYGRTLLAIGRLHRRRGERRAAQERLEEALAIFEGAGARGWAETARRDLGRARARRGTGDDLTVTELAIAELAASGLRNGEIAAQLFVTPKTVEANLTRIYRKLGIRSRAALDRQLTARRGKAGDT